MAIAALKTTYNRLFRSKMLLEEAMASVDKEFGHVEEVRYFLDFIRESKRGVIR